MTYLCMKPIISSQAKSVSTQENLASEHPENNSCENVSAQSATIDLISSAVKVCNVQGTEPVLLPTFTAYIKGADSELHKARVFLDSGCQKVFIRSALAKNLNLETVNDCMSLKIHGFLSSSEIKTKSVGFDLSIAGKFSKIEAICIENISTSFNTGNIKPILDTFWDKGYQFADCDLTNNTGNVADIDIMLGTEYSHILPTSDVVFGVKDNESFFKSSRIGVLLTGGVRKLQSNLPFLPANALADSSAASFLATLEPCDADPENIHISGKTAAVILPISADSGKDVLDDFSIDYEQLERLCQETLNISDVIDKDTSNTDTNLLLIDFLLSNMERQPDGRLVIPITWNSKNCHNLAKNYNLSKSILLANFEKFRHAPDHLSAYDQVFREQEALGIIERIENPEIFMRENPSCAFLPHMGIVKPDRLTTKIRIVFMSNLVGKKDNPNALSNNNCVLPGPALNDKLSSALMMLRFDKFMFIADIQKAFSMCAVCYTGNGPKQATVLMVQKYFWNNKWDCDRHRYNSISSKTVAVRIKMQHRLSTCCHVQNSYGRRSKR